MSESSREQIEHVTVTPVIPQERISEEIRVGEVTVPQVAPQASV